jgi:hypothetical protein
MLARDRRQGLDRSEIKRRQQRKPGKSEHSECWDDETVTMHVFGCESDGLKQD